LTNHFNIFLRQTAYIAAEILMPIPKHALQLSFAENDPYAAPFRTETAFQGLYLAVLSDRPKADNTKRDILQFRLFYPRNTIDSIDG